MTRGLAPIRVCLVTQRWAPSFAGAALRFRQYLPGLRKRGLEVDVVCSTAPSEDAHESVSRWEELEFGQIMQAEDVEGTCVRRVKLPAGRSLGRNMLFRRAVIRHLGETRAAVVQFLTLAPLRTYPGNGPKLKKIGVRSVFTGTQMWTFSNHTVKRTLQRHWIRHPIQRLDHLVVSSLVMRDFYRSLGVNVPMSVVPNGVNVERFRPGDPDAERRATRDMLGISRTANVVVFVGSIIRRKGVDLLIDAFARVAAEDPLAELVLVGPQVDDGTDEGRTFKAQINESVCRSGAAGRIHFAGQVPSVDMYLRASDVFVLPSRREGMGNVVLEAMATGIPAVLTPYLGLPEEFGKPGTQYTLSAPDATSLASNIGSLLRNPDRRQAIGDAGQRWVSDHMNMSVAIDAYAQIYHDLAVHGTLGTQSQALSCID